MLSFMLPNAGSNENGFFDIFIYHSNFVTLKSYDGLLQYIHKFGYIESVFEALTVLSVELNLVTVHIDLVPLVVIVHPAVYQPEINIDVHLHRLLKLHFILYIN